MTAPRRLQLGDTVHGFAAGLFGRDHYACVTVESLGRDWAVLRAPDGSLRFLAGEKDMTFALDHLKPNLPTQYTNGCDCIPTPPEAP